MRLESNLIMYFISGCGVSRHLSIWLSRDFGISTKTNLNTPDSPNDAIIFENTDNGHIVAEFINSSNIDISGYMVVDKGGLTKEIAEARTVTYEPTTPITPRMPKKEERTEKEKMRDFFFSSSSVYGD